MDEKLTKAIDEFMSQRMNDHEMDVPDAVTEAVTHTGECEKRLAATFTEEQAALWRNLEDALSLQSGEEAYFYYRAGFQDAIRFLIDGAQEQKSV